MNPSRLRSCSYARACVAGMLCWSNLALADVDQCVEAHSQGQVLRDEGKLLASSAALLECASDDACPAPIKLECEQFLQAVKTHIPTLVFAGRDHLGRDVEGVRIYKDGTATEWVSGDPPIAVDPGLHQIRFEHPDGRVIEQTVHAVQGEKARLVIAEFSETELPVHKTPATVTADVSQPPSEMRQIITYAFGGLAVVGLASFAVLGLQGRSREADLRGSCAPDCTSEQKESVAEKYFWADVSLAVAGVSLAGGAVVYWAPLGSNDTAASIAFTGEF